MAESSRRVRDSIVEWSEDEVQEWLAELGYPQYEEEIKSEYGVLAESRLLICQGRASHFGRSPHQSRS